MESEKRELTKNARGRRNTERKKTLRGKFNSPFLKVAIIPYVKIVEDIIKQGIKEGEFVDLNPSIAASALLGMMQITIIRLHFGFARFSITDAKEQIKRIYFGGLLK